MYFVSNMIRIVMLPVATGILRGFDLLTTIYVDLVKIMPVERVGKNVNVCKYITMARARIFIIYGYCKTRHE